MDIGTNAGKAWVGLRVELGPLTSSHNTFQKPSPLFRKRKCGPSRLRRRERRATARAATNPEDMVGATCDNIESTEEVEQAGEAYGTEEVGPSNVAISSVVQDEQARESLIASEVACSEITETAENAIQDITKVSCIATLDNCPDESMNKQYADFMREFLFSEKLVLDNVYSNKFEHVSSRSFRYNQFVHNVLITLNVKHQD